MSFLDAARRHLLGDESEPEPVATAPERRELVEEPSPETVEEASDRSANRRGAAQVVRAASICDPATFSEEIIADLEGRGGSEAVLPLMRNEIPPHTWSAIEHLRATGRVLVSTVPGDLYDRILIRLNPNYDRGDGAG